jgi:hypothetical protein
MHQSVDQLKGILLRFEIDHSRKDNFSPPRLGHGPCRSDGYGGKLASRRRLTDTTSPSINAVSTRCQTDVHDDPVISKQFPQQYRPQDMCMPRNVQYSKEDTFLVTHIQIPNIPHKSPNHRVSIFTSHLDPYHPYSPGVDVSRSTSIYTGEPDGASSRTRELTFLIGFRLRRLGLIVLREICAWVQ